MNFTSAGSSAAGLQWTLTYPAADITAISSQPGTAATAAGKTLSCAGSPGSYTCILSGADGKTVGDGPVAVVNVTLAAATPYTSIQVGNLSAVTPDGSSLTVSATGGVIGTSNTPLTLTALTCSPATLVGAGTVSCSVQLSDKAPASGAIVAISSNSSNLQAPSSVTVPAGQSAISFTATAAAVQADEAATLTAAYTNASVSARVALVASVSASSLTCAPSTLTSGAAALCTLTLSKPAAAPLSVTLASSTPSLAVPATATVAAGAASTTFSATAGTISASTSATVTATVNGRSTTASIALTGASAGVLSYLSCPSTQGSSSVVCTVALTASRPGAVAVALSSNNTAVAIPASVTIPAGSLSTTVTAQRLPSATDQTVTVTASLDGVSKSALLFVPGALTVQSLSCGAAAVTAGSSFTCTLALNKADSTGGSVITLSGQSVTVPSSLTTTAGATTLSFTATAAKVAAATTGALSATLNGYSTRASVQINPVAAGPAISSLQCSPSTISSSELAACTVSLSGPAPDGGSAIALSTNNQALTSPASVTVAAGSSAATFNVTAGVAATDQAATLSASYNGSSRSVALTISSSMAIASLKCAASTLAPGQSTTCAIALNRPAAASASVTVVVSGYPVTPALSIPAVTVAANSATATFTISALPTATAASGSLLAILNGSVAAIPVAVGQ